MNRQTGRLAQPTSVSAAISKGSRHTSRRQVLKAGSVCGLAAGIGLIGSGLTWGEESEPLDFPPHDPSVRPDVAPSAAFSARLGSSDRNLTIFAPNLGERLNLTYFRDGQYDRGSLEALDNLFRDGPTGNVAKIDTGVYDQLFALSNVFGNREINMLHGYRAAETTESMRARGLDVATFSYHGIGRAADIYISNIPISEMHVAALKLTVGGVGYFPGSNFVHIDTGPLRNWPSRYHDMGEQYRLADV